MHLFLLVASKLTEANHANSTQDAIVIYLLSISERTHWEIWS